MMKFEDLEVWKRSVAMSAEMYKETQLLKDFGFRDQITRSALSVPSNIAEGFERLSNKETINFLSYAKASCGELRTQLIIGEKALFLNADFASRAIQESREITAMLVALIKKRKEFEK